MIRIISKLTSPEIFYRHFGQLAKVEATAEVAATATERRNRALDAILGTMKQPHAVNYIKI